MLAFLQYPYTIKKGLKARYSPIIPDRIPEKVRGMHGRNGKTAAHGGRDPDGIRAKRHQTSLINRYRKYLLHGGNVDKMWPCRLWFPGKVRTQTKLKVRYRKYVRYYNRGIIISFG